MTYYALVHTNLKEEKPELLEVFSINRTGRPFSCVGIDMALEQTINAEAKRCLKGIVSFTDVSTAVNRWIVTGPMRSQIVNCLLESYNSDNKELNKLRWKEIKKDVEKIKEYICSTTNLFKEMLFLILRQVNKPLIAQKVFFLMSYQGEKKRNDFVTDCEEDSARIERPIKKSKIVNFAKENFQRKNKSKKAAAIAQTKGTRDMLGRLLFLSIQRSKYTISRVIVSVIVMVKSN